ncbi:MAG: GNAT family N-acetyltransferase [Novosphingobium sp. 28-62-57]|uniref:GNAT family N-acetyltransferase n=1 Tax=unclassified Novosphingobium TaxID=2644732 RepID=UPI000BCDFE21|nr:MULTISPECIES: GNAT family N-acetyltransferase [unclassified Novosphingobium]OYW48376.1 MAG: GNAT family N-acetyltransferase [Novosphingobium sp. 12-62-10]OYZ08105.1 MAG: GNAT family N-acetyltransferase [Novosphingobium sp. 28-62-57]OYZ97454.1 MAG: GNAT family N-acetyltransferase [Novosphingobium sp. 17-62-8]HQS68778.1 GNAT family N-acetyltransferase [Novosphingobium sp.]
MDLRIVEDDLSGEAIRALVALHLSGMHAHSPACKVHALPVEKLRQPGVTFYSAWADGNLAGMGAIKELDSHHGELKSMRVAPEWLGRGVGEAILLHLLNVAQTRGYSRVSLETGQGPAFEPALGLYRKHGFVNCEAFADYVLDDFSQCLTLQLPKPQPPGVQPHPS